MNQEQKTRLERAGAYIAERCTEASTVRALIVIGSSVFGAATDPARLESYVIGGVLLAQTVAILLPDSWKKGLPNGNDQAS